MDYRKIGTEIYNDENDEYYFLDLKNLEQVRLYLKDDSIAEDDLKEIRIEYYKAQFKNDLKAYKPQNYEKHFNLLMTDDVYSYDIEDILINWKKSYIKQKIRQYKLAKILGITLQDTPYKFKLKV